MKKFHTEKIKTDVLVVGGGAAGLTAAIEARSKGVDVTIVSKSRVGRSGNTIISGTGLAMMASDSNPKDSSEIFIRDTIRSGREINDQAMIDLYLKSFPKLFAKLPRWGVALRKAGKRFVLRHTPGHSIPRTFSPDSSCYPFSTRGLSLTIPLLETAKRSNVSIVDYAPIIKLLISEGRISGAVAINKKTQTVLIFQSKVVILAAGGGGGVYARNNNTADITGDSYSLAYDAGAALRDMEFVQFYPNMIFSPIKINISSSLFGEGAFLRNAHGEKFMKNYDKKEDMATRDMMSRAILNEMTAGRGHASGVFLDCRKVSRETFVTKYGKLLPLLSKVNIDPSNDFIPITPATHFFMGGIAVNNRCESTIPGLLACGESAGGLHGANRLAGNALSETFVFGMIAGDQAAHLSKEKYRIDVPTFDIVPSQSGTLSVSEIKQYLRKSNWKYLSISRDKKSIEKAIAIINEVSTSFGNIRIKTVYDLVSFFELKCMNSTARLIAESGRHRTESRGAHFRSDYPVMNDESHKGSYYSVKCNGKLKIRFQPIGS